MEKLVQVDSYIQNWMFYSLNFYSTGIYSTGIFGICKSMCNWYADTKSFNKNLIVNGFIQRRILIILVISMLFKAFKYGGCSWFVFSMVIKNNSTMKKSILVVSYIQSWIF